ncbi:MAG: response regulator transcription factor [Ardenticatenaceae bacterium]|nr:response regulator transcription factor [Ardenticatenaceae bacterium]
MDPRRLLLVDPHPHVRRALRARLAQVPGINVAGETGEADEALRMAVHLRPDFVVLEPKHLDAIRLVRHLCEVIPESCIVVYTSYPDLWEEEALLGAGARAYLVKTFDLGSLSRWLRGSVLPEAGGNCGGTFLF